MRDSISNVMLNTKAITAQQHSAINMIFICYVMMSDKEKVTSIHHGKINNMNNHNHHI
jgi:hypothetical protein